MAKQSPIFEFDFKSHAWECSERTEAVDYTQIAKDAIALLGTKEAVVAWGWKLNTRGLRLKEGQFIKVGDYVMTTDDLITRIHSQPGFKNFMDSAASRIGIGKKVVTASRIARATAGIVSIGIKTGKLSLGPDCEKLREMAKITSEDILPKHFSFINAAYGMNNDDIKKHWKGFSAFLAAFQVEINNAHASGWVSSSKTAPRDYVKEFNDYASFRGVALA